MSDGQATHAEVEARVFEVYKMLIAGLRHEEIVRVANEKMRWDVKPRQIRTYIQRARQRFESEAAVKREAELGKALARLDGLYAKALNRQDLKTALAVQRELNDLLGLAEAEKVALSGNVRVEVVYVDADDDPALPQ